MHRETRLRSMPFGKPERAETASPGWATILSGR